jgi:hypothetical protein
VSNVRLHACRNGGKDLIVDASMTLAYGRRYGLIGRNGTGESGATEPRELQISTALAQECCCLLLLLLLLLPFASALLIAAPVDQWTVTLC